jgi:oligopeptide transport system permease protein
MSSVPAIPIPLSTFVERPDSVWRRALRSGRILIGGGILLVMLIACVCTLPLTLQAKINGQANPLFYNEQVDSASRRPPSGESVARWLGTDSLGRSMLSRSLLGGAISLLIGVAAAIISVVLGVTAGLLAGYRGGWTDTFIMRFVDILYGLPYILMVILFKIAFEERLTRLFNGKYMPDFLRSNFTANLVVLFVAIGLVSWLTMARVVRGQVLSLRSQPFIEACRASGLTEWRIFTRHLFPNLVGPITVYATLIIPQAILQESFLSFLGIGVQPPMPTWGLLASEGLMPALFRINPQWWMLVVPCTLLGITLLSLNFLGDGLRDLFDPRRSTSRI